jgi:D-3-phosphoglycerate dehydrogenase
MFRYQLLAANYNEDLLWVYDDLRKWLSEKDVELVMARCKTEQDVFEKGSDADFYVAYRFKVTRKIIENLSRLKVIMASGSGYDHIDVKAATDEGVIVTNCATFNAQDVAEHTISLLFAAAAKIPQLDRMVKRGMWPCTDKVQPTYRLKGKSVGLIGFGRIGKLVAKMATGLGFQVLANDPYRSEDEMKKLGVESVSLNEMLQRADFVSTHLRLTGETGHFLGTKQFRLMKPTAYVINTSRGGVIDERALTEALSSGWIAGAALDVMEKEPPDPGNPLLSMDNVILTSHSAGTSVEVVRDWQNELRIIIEAVLQRRWPINVLNPEVKPRLAIQP